MNPNLKSLALAALFATPALPAVALAQGSSTHGGDAVVCFRHKEVADRVLQRLQTMRQTRQNVDPLRADGIADIETVRLYDFHSVREAQATGLLDPLKHLIEDQRGFAGIVADREQNAKDTNHVLWQDYLKTGRELLPPPPHPSWNPALNGVAEIDDSADQVLLSEKCLRIQVANQVHVGTDVTVNFDTRLFKLMPPVDQAGLITHEWIYLALIRANQETNSLRTREINVMLYQRGFVPARAQVLAASLQAKLGLGGYNFECAASDECFYHTDKGSFALNRKEAGLRSREPGLPAHANLYSYARGRELGDLLVRSLEWKDGRLAGGTLDPRSYPAGMDPANPGALQFDPREQVTGFVFTLLKPSSVGGLTLTPFPAELARSHEFSRVLGYQPTVTTTIDRQGRVLSAQGGLSIQDRHQVAQCLSAPTFYQDERGALLRECETGVTRANSYNGDYFVHAPLVVQGMLWTGKVYFNPDGRIDFEKSSAEAGILPIAKWQEPLLDPKSIVTEACGPACLRVRSGGLKGPWRRKLYVQLKGGVAYFFLGTTQIELDHLPGGEAYISAATVGWNRNEAQCGEMIQFGGVPELKVGSRVTFHPNEFVRSIEFKKDSPKFCGTRFQGPVVEFDAEGRPKR